MPVALSSALVIVAVYLLLRRLWGERVALAGSILVALDPFFLAHSRVLHQDALVTGFCLLSVLVLALSLQDRVSWPAVVCSGGLAGLAVLSKPTALALCPWAAGWLLVSVIRRGPLFKDWHKAAGLLLGWTLSLAVVYFLLWPAMWANPVETVSKMWARSTELAAEGQNQFFFGQATGDPGPAFYPVVVLFRTTPLVWVGLAALVWLAARRQASTTAKGWPALFVGLFLVLISFSAKKNDRYALPVFPLLDILAAIGLVECLARVWPRIQTRVGARLTMAGLILIALAQVGLVFWYHPYYLAYYNPLVGGPWTAPGVLLIGWGEGLDQAGRYLDRKADAAALAAASYYRREFSPYFRGEIRKLSDAQPDDFDLLAWHASDYVVSYASQRQTDQPNSATARYLRTLTPEHVVRLRGIDYAWIYRTPEYVPDELIPAQRIVRRRFGRSILLLGYDEPSFKTSEAPSVQITLYWQCLSPLSVDYQVDLQLVGRAGQAVAEEISHPYEDQYRTSLWPRGLVLRDRHAIDVSRPVAPGEYRVAVGLVDAATGQRLAPAGEDVIIGPLRVGEDQASH
jgi:hypothetical protein